MEGEFPSSRGFPFETCGECERSEHYCLATEIVGRDIET